MWKIFQNSEYGNDITVLEHERKLQFSEITLCSSDT